MRVGYMGLGKLGLPVALAAEAAGHHVLGCDPSPVVEKILKERELPYMEVQAPELLRHTRIQLVSPSRLVSECDVIFVAIQTPHEPGHDGSRPQKVPRDFDYRHLVNGLTQLSSATDGSTGRTPEVAVISTCLPTTFRRLIEPVIHPRMKYTYNPYFIAMGTTIPDFLKPEFVLLGSDEPQPDHMRSFSAVRKFYDETLPDAKQVEMSVTSAELTKMAYNTFIGQKIVFANTIMEIAEKTGADVDDVTDALALATRRLISPAYMRAGMGDGGGCHPRDNIALWKLAQDLHLSHNLFKDVTEARESQTKWLVTEFLNHSPVHLPLAVLGEAYKPETNLTAGSPARLFANELDARSLRFEQWDPYTSEGPPPVQKAHSYFIATAHSAIVNMKFPRGSFVMDPWRLVPKREDITVRRIGEGRA